MNSSEFIDYCINSIKEKINKEKKAIYRLNKAIDLLK